MAKEHFLEQHDPERKDFQIDRIILFTDAVFAIAITLLIIEIKAPEINEHATSAQIFDQLSQLLPKFFGFILSFFVIAIYWRSHHRIFGFVTNYNPKLIWLNFYFLFTIVLMPFSSAYYSENTNYNIPFYFYHVNIILTGVINFSLIRYVMNPANHLIKHKPTLAFKKQFLSRALAIPAIFLTGILLSLFHTRWGLILSRMSPLLIWPVLVIIRMIYRIPKKKA